MKKRHVVVIALAASCMMNNAALADGLEIDTAQINAESKTVDEDKTVGLNKNEDDRSIFDVGSTDVVTIGGDGSYNVETDLLNCQLQVPFGWLCLTQDFKLQYDTFSYIYTDPMAEAKNMVKAGEHYFLIDYDFENCIDIYFSEDYLGSLIGNAADLDQEDNETVFGILSSSYFPQTEGETVDYGQNHFYHFRNAANTNHYYETFVNGVCVDVFLTSLYGTEIPEYTLEDVELLLEQMGFEG